jgi:hypothetical protein
MGTAAQQIADAQSSAPDRLIRVSRPTKPVVFLLVRIVVFVSFQGPNLFGRSTTGSKYIG